MEEATKSRQSVRWFNAKNQPIVHHLLSLMREACPSSMLRDLLLVCVEYLMIPSRLRFHSQPMSWPWQREIIGCPGNGRAHLCASLHVPRTAVCVNYLHADGRVAFVFDSWEFYVSDPGVNVRLDYTGGVDLDCDIVRVPIAVAKTGCLYNHRNWHRMRLLNCNRFFGKTIRPNVEQCRVPGPLATEFCIGRFPQMVVHGISFDAAALSTMLQTEQGDSYGCTSSQFEAGAIDI